MYIIILFILLIICITFKPEFNNCLNTITYVHTKCGLAHMTNAPMTQNIFDQRLKIIRQ